MKKGVSVGVCVRVDGGLKGGVNIDNVYKLKTVTCV